jgi:hypothetical protein
MPSLVTDLSPMQHVWLTENQGGRGEPMDVDIDMAPEPFYIEQRSTIFRLGGRPPPFPPRIPPVEEPSPWEAPRAPSREFQGYQYSLQPAAQPYPSYPRSNGHLSSAENFRPRPASAGGRAPIFPHSGDKLTWQQSFENLQVYQQIYGDCNVPQKYKENRKLGGWVNKQRKKKKNPAKYGKLTEEQIESLNNLGFKWNLENGC